jgi:hypothetical protein
VLNLIAIIPPCGVPSSAKQEKEALIRIGTNDDPSELAPQGTRKLLTTSNSKK